MTSLRSVVNFNVKKKEKEKAQKISNVEGRLELIYVPFILGENVWYQTYRH